MGGSSWAPFGTPKARLRALRDGVQRVKTRLALLNPPPLGPMPLMIAGGGEQLTLRLVARYADMSNTPGTPQVVRHKNEVIDEYCLAYGRDPQKIERTCNIAVDAVERMHEWVEAGAQRLQIQLDHPFDLRPVELALKLRDG
jgi:alkanesulfonate monooxygenase SsuD/methylene tetrahydromethanopterin reductase-like flavin-dependent oxidoreductase (luciferase family)